MLHGLILHFDMAIRFLSFFFTNKKMGRSFEKASGPMWIFDKNTLAFLAVNEAAVKLYGYTREEFLKMTLKDIRPEWEIQRLERHINEQALYGKNTGTWKHLKKNGDIILVVLNAEDTMYNGKEQRLVRVTDITHTLKR